MTRLEIIQKQLKELRLYREYLLSIRNELEKIDKVKIKKLDEA